MRKKQKKYSAFTIIEMLVAITILAILAVAISFAFEASIDNYTANEQMFKSMNMVRQSLNRITTQLRSADFVTLTADEASNQCTLVTSDGDSITYEYRNASDSLYLKDNATSNEYLLCPNVTDMTITKDEGMVRETQRVKTVKLSMTVKVGNEIKTIAAAAVVRKNMD